MDWGSLFHIGLIPEALIKLTFAAFLGGMIGLERETHGQAAGFRTFILVSVGSCLIMMLSLHVESMYRALGAESAVRVDPGRIASYALAGMGFLGAGAIISVRGSVRGLTTAAGMWMITAVGLAVGSGYFIPATLATFTSLVILFFLRYTKPFFKRDISTTLTLVSDDVGGQLNRIEMIVGKYPRTQVQYIDLKRSLEQGVITFRLHLSSKEGMEWRDLTGELAELSGVRELTHERSGAS